MKIENQKKFPMINYQYLQINGQCLKLVRPTRQAGSEIKVQDFVIKVNFITRGIPIWKLEVRS